MIGGPVTVLLVEDNLGDARLMREMLRDPSPAAYEVRPVESRKAAGKPGADDGDIELSHDRPPKWEALPTDLQCFYCGKTRPAKGQFPWDESAQGGKSCGGRPIFTGDGRQSMHITGSNRTRGQVRRRAAGQKPQGMDSERQ